MKVIFWLNLMLLTTPALTQIKLNLPLKRELDRMPVLKRTGQPETVSFIWPVQDPAHANERRRRAGFCNTLEASSANMGMPYQAVSLAYAKQMAQEAALLAHEKK